MNQIYEANDSFPLDKIILTTPVVISNGTFFIKYLLNNEPFYIQPPKCTTRQGLIKGGKKMYCDLMFTNENNSFIKWIEDLECYSHNYIFKNREAWFESQLNLEDIVDSFLSALKIYRSGKFYILRTIVPSHLGKCLLRLYDEQELSVDYDKLVDSTTVIPILEFQGIRCSTKNFQIDIEIKQMMILKPMKLFEKCVIRNNNVQDKEVRLDAEIVGHVHKTTDVFACENDKSIVTNNIMLGEEELINDLAKQDTLMNELAKEETLMRDLAKEDTIMHDLRKEETLVGDLEKEELMHDLKKVEEKLQDYEEDKKETFALTLDLIKDEDDLEELNLEDELISQEDPITLTTRNDIYYQIYQEAMKKAKSAKHLAISSYLKAKQIKNLYMLEDDDIADSKSELNEITNIN